MVPILLFWIRFYHIIKTESVTILHQNLNIILDPDYNTANPKTLSGRTVDHKILRSTEVLTDS